jgi:hypothetical protein
MATVYDVLQRVRVDLHEPVAAVWSDADIVQWINAGIYRVMVRLKGVRDDWATRRMRSTDSAETINGTTYNPSNLQITAGTTIYTLPPNLLEIRTLEPLNQSDINAGIKFLPRDMSSIEWINMNREQPTTQVVYFYDLYGTNSLRITPTPTATIDTEMYYIAAPSADLGISEEITQIPVWALHAVEQYAVYRAMRAINHPDANSELARADREIAEMVSMASPRETNDPKIVEGIFDEEDMLPFVFTY